MGVDGVANFGGRIVFEPIAELRDQAAYGRSGTFEWGFWEDLSAANSWVAAALDFVCNPVANARIDVEPPPESVIGTGPGKLSKALSDEVTDFIRWNLTEKLELGAFTSTAARGFLKSGFALFEDLYDVRDDGKLYLRALEERLPMSLAPTPWVEGEDGRLRGIRQLGYRAGRSVAVELPVERVVLCIWQRQGSNWQGRSAFRAVQYIAGKVMPQLLKLIGVTLQREGAGIPVAEAIDKDAPLSDQQREDLVELLANLTYHESASAVMPAGWKLNWLFSGGANKGHVLEVWRELGIVVLQQLGAQQLALGTSNTGSRAVGETHAAFSSFKPGEVLRLLERVINGTEDAFTGLVPRIIRANWGALPAYPRVKLTLERPEVAIAELGSAVVAAKNAGLLTPTAKDENVVRSRLGLPPITEEERDAAKQKAASLAPQLQPQPPGKEEPEGDDEDAPKGKLQASAQRGGWVPWRALRASEARTDFKGIDAYFTAQREAFEKRVRPVVVGMLAKAGLLISSAMADGVVQPEEIATIPLDASRLSKVVAEYLAEVRDAGKASTRRELATGVLRAAAEEEQEDEREDEAVTQESDDVIEAERNRVVRRIVNRTKAELEREAVDALRTGADAQDVLDRAVARQLDTGAFRSDAGSITTKAFNVGRDEAARILGGVAEVEYSALLDSSTCEACRALDGATAPFNSAEHDRLVPPNRDCAGGDNCRCLLVMIPGSPGEEGSEE